MVSATSRWPHFKYQLTNVPHAAPSYDGSGQADLEREAYLNAQGFRILRLTNEQVQMAFQIGQSAGTMSPTSHPVAVTGPKHAGALSHVSLAAHRRA